MFSAHGTRERQPEELLTACRLIRCPAARPRSLHFVEHACDEVSVAVPVRTMLEILGARSVEEATVADSVAHHIM